MNSRPLSSEIRDAQKACRDLVTMADISPFGPRLVVVEKVEHIQRVLSRVLQAITGETNVDVSTS